MYEVLLVFIAVVCAFCIGWLLSDKRMTVRIIRQVYVWTRGRTKINFSVAVDYTTLKGPQNAIDAWYAGIAFRTAELLYDAAEAAQRLSREHNRKLLDKRRRS